MTARRYPPVTHRATHVAIVATGPSVRDADLSFPPEVTVIAVNGAIPHIPRADFWITTDHSYRPQSIMVSPVPGVTYYAAIWDRYLLIYDHQAKVAHVRFLRRIDGKDYPVGFEKAMPGLPESKDTIHAGNSAWGALQLAWHMEARHVALFGVDANLDGYAWDDGRPKSMAHVPSLFASAVAQLEERGVEVVNGSPASAVTCFPRMSPHEARRWLLDRVRLAA